MMASWWDYLHMPLSWICLIAGVFFVFSGALGMVRFPNFFTRVHAGSVTDSFGFPLILLGYLFSLPLGLVSIKILLLLVFAMVTSATAAHALARAAIMDGVLPRIVPEKAKEESF